MNKKNRFCAVIINSVLDKIFSMYEEDNCLFPQIKDFIVEEFSAKVYESCFKELVYCLNYERENRNLLGDTSEQRHKYFSENYCINSVNKEFPNLIDEIVEEFKGKVFFAINVLKKFEENSEKIMNNLYKASSTVSYEVDKIYCSGDWHDNKCVIVFDLKNGQKVVYKPRQEFNQLFFQKIIRIFFCDVFAQLYNCVSISGLEGHWCKFVEHIYTNKYNQFYYNYGKIVFIAYLLGMNDIHYENMIAHDQFPVITDLETIFSSYVFVETNRKLYDAQYKAVNILSNGALATGLLPVLSLIEYFGGDVSCLSNNGTKIKVQKIKNSGTDEMSIYSEYEMVKNVKHLPDENVQPLSFGTVIQKGFSDAIEIYRENQLVIMDLIEQSCTLLETRVLFAMSKSYSKIIKIKSEVIYRSDSSKFLQLVERLKGQNDFDIERYNYEKIELCKANIPCYFWNVESPRVYAYLDNIKTFISTRCILTIKELIEKIELHIKEEEIERQIQFIQDSIRTSKALLEKVELTEKFGEKSQKNEAVDINTEINKVIGKIKNQAVRGNDGTIEWIGLTVAEQDQLAYQTLDESIYKGVCGLGMELISFAGSNNDKEITSLVWMAIHTLFIKQKLGLLEKMNSSYFNGLTGVYSFLEKAIELFEIKEGEGEIYSLLETIKTMMYKNIEKTTLYDNISGLMSTIIFFYNRYERGDFFAKDVMQKISMKYLEEFDIEYVIKNFNFASFAHGYEAYITAFLCLYNFSGREDYLLLIHQLYSRQQQLYMGDFCWEDTRQEDTRQADTRQADKKTVHFWCHGSCGIMISRLLWKKMNLLKNQKAFSAVNGYDIDTDSYEYMKKIVSGDFDGVNYSLCHGNMGLVEYLISYQKLYSIEDIKIDDYIQSMIHKSIINNYSCLTLGALNSISFMVGEAGIIYVFQRHLKRELCSISALEVI